MKRNHLRFIIFFAVLGFLCLGAIYQYMNFGQNRFAGAVMVFAVESKVAMYD